MVYKKDGLPEPVPISNSPPVSVSPEKILIEISIFVQPWETYDTKTTKYFQVHENFV